MEGMTDAEAIRATSLGYHELGDYLAAHAEEDTFILAKGQTSKPQDHLVPVIRGTEEERKARIDGWARMRHVAAFWHEESHTYRAVKNFGPVAYVVYMIPDAPVSREPELAVA